MSCNCNNQPTNYNICNPSPCQEPQDCSCPTILSTDCVTYGGNDLECSGIVTGQTLTETIEQLDTFICEKVDDITNALTLKNIGTGAKVYKGDDLLGRKELRTIESSTDIITVTEATNTIQINIDEDILNNFIEENQKTYSVDNVGSGVEVYKDSTVVGDNTQFNFRTVVQEDQGTGESFLRDIQQTTDELKVRVKTLVSDNLTITATDEEVRIETPMTASIPALYVNDLYVPTYQEWLSENSAQNGGTPVVGFEFIGRGTLAVPFTNTYVYTLGAPATPPVVTANSAIQNALDGDTVYSYVGAGTRLSPDKVGQTIIVQNNNTSYTFTGDFEYASLRLRVDANVTANTVGYLIDMDNSLNIPTSNVIDIEVLENRTLSISGQGFKNNGTTVVTTNYVNYRQIRLLGDGFISFLGNDITKYLLSSDKDSIGNTTVGFNNDGAWQFEVGCYLVSEFQGLVAIGGVSQVLALGATFQTGTVTSDVNINLEAFKLKGGFLKIRRDSTIVYYGSNITTRLKLFVIEPTNGFTPTLEQSNSLMAGNCEIIYSKENNNVANLIVANTGGSEANCVNIFDSTNLWSVSFRNNFFNSGNIDITKADLTQGNNVSSINTIGNNVIEILTVHNDRAAALLAGRPLYSAYLKTSGVAYPTTAGWVRDIVLPA